MSATDPYGGNRHTLSDPRDDDHSVSVHAPTQPDPRLRLPRAPCSKLPLCSLPNYHLGDCDTQERLELVRVQDSTASDWVKT